MLQSKLSEEVCKFGISQNPKTWADTDVGVGMALKWNVLSWSMDLSFSPVRSLAPHYQKWIKSIAGGDSQRRRRVHSVGRSLAVPHFIYLWKYGFWVSCFVCLNKNSSSERWILFPALEGPKLYAVSSTPNSLYTLPLTLIYPMAEVRCAQR